MAVRECPGFVVNRLLMPYLNEAVICLQEGAATAAEIDAALGREGFGWPMGPLALMDMLGLDVCHHIIAYLDAEWGERFSEAALLRALVRGRAAWAKRAGRGFMPMPAARPGAVDALIEQLRRGRARRRSAWLDAFSVRSARWRLLLNEAFLVRRGRDRQRGGH